MCIGLVKRLTLRLQSIWLRHQEEMHMAGVGTTAKTGEHCPESGIWQSMDSPSTTAPIAKGNVMPPHNNKAVTWKLTQLA